VLLDSLVAVPVGRQVARVPAAMLFALFLHGQSEVKTLMLRGRIMFVGYKLPKKLRKDMGLREGTAG
jgi:hypothetical protein